MTIPLTGSQNVSQHLEPEFQQNSYHLTKTESRKFSYKHPYMESIEKTSIGSKYRHAVLTSLNGGGSSHNNQTMRLERSPVLYNYNIDDGETTDVVRDEPKIEDEPIIFF